MDDLDFDELQVLSKQQKEDVMKNVLVKPSIWQRLKKLPIYLHKEGTSKEHKVHISDEKLAEKMPKEREKFLSLIKKYPNIVEEIEKHPRLEQIVFTGDPLPSQGQVNTPLSKRRKIVFGATYPEFKSTPEGQLEPEIAKTPIAKQIQKDEAIVAVSLHPQAHTERIPKDILYPHLAKTTFHELRHVGQIESYHKQPKDFGKLFKGEYEKRKGEKQAREYAEKKEFNPLREWEKQYKQGKTAIQGSYQNQEVQDAIRRANIALKKTGL